MDRAVIGLLCVVLVFRLTSGNPVFYQRPTVMNKVEFSDRDIDADRIDPLIEQSEEEDGRSNEAVNTRTDMAGVGENGVSKDITTVTEITVNEPTVTLTTAQYIEPTEQQQQHTGNETKDNDSTEAELDGEMTTAAVIPSDDTPPDLKPTLPSLYDNSTKDIDNSESDHVKESSNVSVSDLKATTKPVSSESSATVTQTAFPTERQSETTESVTTAVSETVTNDLELTSSLIVPASPDWFRAYSSSDVTDSTEQVTNASSSSPTEERISTVEVKEEITISSLTGIEEISLPSIDSNAIDKTDNNESSIEDTTKDSKATFDELSTVGITVTKESEETLLETTTVIFAEVMKSEISETTMITPTFTVVETSDSEEESATEASTLQFSDIPTTTERYTTSNDGTDPPLTESETIEATTTTSVISTTTGEAQNENNDDTTPIFTTESIESITLIEWDIVSKVYTTTTVESENSTSTLPVTSNTIQPESSALTEGEIDSLTSTTDTSRLSTTEVPDGIDTTVFIPVSSTSISYEAVEDSSTAPVTESPTTFQPTTDMIEQNDPHTTSKYSNTDSMESADETSARSNDGSNQQDTSVEDQYSTLESFTVATDTATATIAQSISEIVEDIASVASEAMTTGMDLIEDNESTTTSAFPSTVMSTLNLSEPRTTAKGTLPTDDDSGLYTTIDNEYFNRVTTVLSYGEDMRTEKTTTILPYTTVPTPYVNTIDGLKGSTENMRRKTTSGQTNPTSTDRSEEIPNTEENFTNTSQETGSTSKETVSFKSISISDEEAEHEISLTETTSPIGSVSDYVTEQGVMESTLANGFEEFTSIEETDSTLKIRSSASNSLSRTTLPSITLATSTALAENASVASDPTTALNMYSHSIASVETIDPSTSMSVNEEDYPSTSFALLTPENGAASLPTTTILCFAASLTVLAISDNLRLHRRH